VLCRTDKTQLRAYCEYMPTVTARETRAQAYLAESKAFDKLEGRIPGQVGHNPSLWTEWLAALRVATLLSGTSPKPPFK
jgi:hypothetical protein